MKTIHANTLFNDLKKEVLLKMLFGETHMDNYYQEWINKKMIDYETFFLHLDNNHKHKYLMLNVNYVLKVKT